MFDTGNIRYLLTMSDGIQVNLYFRESFGISLAATDRKRRWSPLKTVVRSSLPYFSSCIDERDGIHILHQDPRGDLVHLVYDGGQWEKAVVLKGKESSQYDKHPYIICLGNTSYLFYVLKTSGGSLMSVQRVEADGSITDPVALDYIDESPLPYKLFCNGRNLFLAYCRIRGGEKKHICRSFDFSSAGWKELVSSSVNPMVYGLEALAVHKDEIHLCLKKKVGSSVMLYDFVYDAGNGRLLSESPVCEIHKDNGTAFIAVSQGRLLCYWCDVSGFRTYYSVNDGEGWSRAKSLNMSEDIPFYCFSISGGGLDYASQFSLIPGQYSDGIKLALAENRTQMPKRREIRFPDEPEYQAETYSGEGPLKADGNSVRSNYDAGSQIEELQRLLEGHARELAQLRSEVENIKSMLW